MIRGEAANSKDHKAYAGEGIKKQNRITSSTHWFKSSPLFTGRRLYSLPPAQPFPSARENTRQGPKDTDAVPSVKKSKCTVLERVIDHRKRRENAAPKKFLRPYRHRLSFPNQQEKAPKAGKIKSRGQDDALTTANELYSFIVSTTPALPHTTRTYSNNTGLALNE